PLSICGPNGKAVVSAKRETTHRAGAGQIEDPHDRLFAVIGAKHNPLAVWRDPRIVIRPWRQLQSLDSAKPVDQCAVAILLGGCRAGHVHQRAGVGDTELRGGASRAEHDLAASDALDDRYRSSRDRQCLTSNGT